MVKIMDNQSSIEELDEQLGRVPILSYGSGHMLNDITSSCWFTYLLVFLTDIGLSPRYVPLRDRFCCPFVLLIFVSCYLHIFLNHIE